MQHPLHICTQHEDHGYAAQCKHALICSLLSSTGLISMIMHRQKSSRVLSSKQDEPKISAIECEACAGVCHMARVLHLLLTEPDVLFHTSLLISNLLLVLDQVLRHLPKFRLQSPPAKPHKVMGLHSHHWYSSAHLMYSLMMMVCENLKQKHLCCTRQTSLERLVCLVHA